MGGPRTLNSELSTLDCASSEFREQRLRLDEVTRVKTLGEPLVDPRQQIAGSVALALALPEPRQVRGGARLERLGLLPPGDLQGG